MFLFHEYIFLLKLLCTFDTDLCNKNMHAVLILRRGFQRIRFYFSI